MRGGATRASSLLARRSGDVAIFDTGMAHHAGLLTAALAGQGVSPRDVTLVFNTHAHPDHSHNNVLFPGARIHCSSRDRAWTLAVHKALVATDRPTADDIAPFFPEMVRGTYNPRLVEKVLGIDKLLWDGSRLGDPDQVAAFENCPLPEGIRVIETPGHSPYHVSFQIDATGGPVVVCGDALMTLDGEYEVTPMMPPWCAASARNSRDRLLALPAVLVPGHDAPFDNRAAARRQAPIRT
jgi:glyoxylase-like metal-dependent hydrolase (beta-lactamase superfamily II)